MRSRFLRPTWVPGVALVLAVGFRAAPAHAQACVPGAQLACACPGGGPGVQVCTDDGARLGPCQCGAPATPPVGPPPPRAATPVPPPGAPLYAPMTSQAPAAPAPARDQPKRGRGLLIGGIVTLGVGYFFSLVAGVASMAVAASQQSTDGATCVKGAGWAFVPLFGIAGSAGSYAHYDIVGNYHYLKCGDGTAPIEAGAILDTVLQLGGAGMIGAGVALNAAGRPADGRAGPRSSASASPVQFTVKPGVQGSPLGLTASWGWF